MSAFTPLYSDEMLVLFLHFGIRQFCLSAHVSWMFHMCLKAMYIFAVGGSKFNNICARQNNVPQKVSMS